MADWHRRLIAETRALQGLPVSIEFDPVGIELAARFLASAPAAATLPPPATDRVAAASGAARAGGDAGGAARSGKSVRVPSGRSNNDKARPAATGRAKNNAAS